MKIILSESGGQNGQSVREAEVIDSLELRGHGKLYEEKLKGCSAEIDVGGHGGM